MTTPELSDYLAIARQGLMTPVYRVALADWETPVSAFYKTAAHERAHSACVGARIGLARVRNRAPTDAAGYRA